MCGRFTLTASREALGEMFPLLDIPEQRPRYNIAPTQPVAVVRLNPDLNKPELAMMRWGLIPGWAEEAKIGNRLINARAETAASKPAFRNAFKQRRCLVLADGFYEWHKPNGAKQPYYISRRDRRPFAFAALWEHWDRGEQPIDSCTILTTDANELVLPLHDRMPVILAPEDFPRWLATDTNQMQDLLRPYPSQAMTAYPVNPLVNNPRNDVPTCLERLPLGAGTTLF